MATPIFFHIDMQSPKVRFSQESFKEQPYQDRLDLVAQCFRLTVKKLVNELCKKEILAPVK